MNKKMKAVVLDKPTEAGNVVLCEIPIPEAKSGWVLVKIKAFGMNHSEQIRNACMALDSGSVNGKIVVNLYRS